MNETSTVDSHARPYRVLTLDGGGMRGLYSSTLLRALARLIDQRFVKDEPDLGLGFDMICGTSTGAILASALALGIPLTTVSDLYIKHGESIFPCSMPKPSHRLDLYLWSLKYRKHSAAIRDRLKEALLEFLGDQTLDSVYKKRGIALCIPCVDAMNYQSWVFKTPHNSNKHRDNNYTLVDVCMASTAAPIFFPISEQENPDNKNNTHYFVDGGLWANNPVLVGLIEALGVVEHGRPIQVVSIGTCDQPSGDPCSIQNPDWGVMQWKVGINAIDMSLSSQSYGYTNMAKFLAKRLTDTGWPIEVVRLEEGRKSPEQYSAIGLDRADKIAIKTMVALAEADAQSIHSDIVGNRRQDYAVMESIIKTLP